jgi:hypothetical protein
MTQSEACVFCAIVARTVPCHAVYEERIGDSKAILGHVIAVPSDAQPLNTPCALASVPRMPPRRATATHSKAWHGCRGLDRWPRRREDGVARVCEGGGLATLVSEKLGEDDFTRHFTARRSKIHRRDAHVASGPTLV